LNSSATQSRSPIDFIAVGAQKAGTRALRNYLSCHPDIGLHEAQEAHYFDDERHFGAPAATHDAYEARFPTPRSDLVRGEVTPVYMYWRNAMQRIWTYNPHVRLIVLLRNPIERAFSHWNMERSWQNEPLAFYDALLAERARCRECLPVQNIHYSYVDRGFYSEQLRRIWSFFPEPQVHVMRSDHLRRDPQTTLMSMGRFLGIDTSPFAAVNPAVRHVGLYAEPMDSRALGFLRKMFEFEIRELERMLSWDLSEWLDEPTVSPTEQR